MPLIKRLNKRRALLDTHVWLWLMAGDTTLSSRFHKEIENTKNLEQVLISPISIWEIGMLVEKGRVQLEMDRLQWIEQTLSDPGILLAEISPKIAVLSTRLPGKIHGDPADRILVASAHEQNAVLVTCDKALLNYGKGRFIHVHNPKN